MGLLPGHTEVPTRICRDMGWANRRLLLRAAETLSDRARTRLRTVFDTDDPTGQLRSAWEAKEQLRILLAAGSLEEAGDHLRILEGLVEAAPTVETKRLLRTVTLTPAGPFPRKREEPHTSGR